MILIIAEILIIVAGLPSMIMIWWLNQPKRK